MKSGHDESLSPLGDLENFLLSVQDYLFYLLCDDPTPHAREKSDMKATIEILRFAQVLVERPNSVASQYF